MIWIFCTFVKNTNIMKRIILLLFIIFTYNLHATHIMGGEITWTCIKDPANPDVGKYIFQMKVYRDCDGVALSTLSQQIQMWGANAPLTSITVDFVINTDISPNGDAANSGNACLDCISNPVGAVEEYIYESQPVALPGAPTAAGWHFTWDSCCRNGAVSNLVLSSTTSPSEGFTLRASMYPYISGGVPTATDPCFDNSPKFNESPKTIICTGYPFSYTPNASDAEMDSLVYSWDEPLDDFFTNFNPPIDPAPIPYIAPYAFNNPLPGGVTLNSQTGEISYNSTTAGNFVSVIRVDAYKCGQKIASIYREIQAVLLGCPNLPNGNINLPPVLTPPFPNPTPFYTSVPAGSLVSFNVSAVDMDIYANGSQQDVTLEITGGQMSSDFINDTLCENPPCATFNDGTGVPPPFSSPQIVNGVFEWQTACSHVSSDVGCGNTSNIYTFAVKAFDDFCPASAVTIATITIEVTAAASLPPPDFQCVFQDGNGNVTVDWNHNLGANPSTVYHIYGATNIGGPYNVLADVNYPDDNYTIPAAQIPSGVNYYYLTNESTCADNSDPSDTISPISFAISSDNINCWDDTDGYISIEVLSTMLSPYSYYINGVLNPNPMPYDTVFDDLSAGIYDITVSDNGSCSITVPIEITAPGYPLQALASDTMNVCYGASDGIAIASAAGGTPGYSYEWFDNNFVSFSNNDTAFGLSAGSYYLEVTDVNGCDTFTTVSVIAPQTALSGSPQMYGVACKNDSTGMLVGDAQGSWAPYQYYWLDASFDTLRAPDPLGSFSFSRDTLANLSAGIYNLHVYDAQGCFVQYIMTVGEPATQLSIDSMAIIESIPCYGDNTGKAVLYASGGMPNYTYSWDNGEDSTIAVSLDAGYHAVSLTDDWGCEVIDSIYIPENPEIQSTISTIQNVSCYGNSDGIASISTTGGVPNYIYFWSTGHTGFSMPDTVSGLLHGSYYVTTRDAIGCEVIDSIYITQPEPLSMQASQLAWISCFGADDGLAYASAVGGTPPYTFVWDNNQVGDTVNTLTPGLHTVVVTDAKGCMASDTIFTHEPPELFVHIDDSQTILAYCVNVNTASLTSLASGGTPGYTYLWDDNSVSPQATATASALMPGIYTVTVTDSRGCTATDTRDIDTITNTMDAMISSVQNINGYGISCFGANDGWAMVQAWGAHAPYAYQWYGPNGFINSNDTIAQLYAGTYSVYVYDTNNCVVNRSVVIAEPGELIYTTLGSSDETCLGACDGTVTIDIIGGSAPYTGIATNNTTGAVIHSLMGINNDTLIPGICSGDYTITLTDVNGCSSSLLNGGVDQQAIGYSLSTVAHINPVTVVDVLCNGSATGVLDVLNPNTNPGYSYSWQALNNPGVTISTSLQATGLQAGGYVLFAHYTNPTNPNQPYPGCSTTDTIFVNELDAISASATIEMVDCWDDQTGSISVIVQGGTSPYNLVWNPGGNTSPILNNIGAGTYTLSMTDINNCQQIEMFQITQPQAITFDVDQNGYVLSVQNLNGGTPGFTYKWYKQVPGPDTQVGSGTTYTVTQYGTYYVEVTDANACVEISENFLYAETYNCENGSCVDPGNNTGQYTSLAACQNACNPTDIGEQENNPLTIYPNPFTKETTLDFGKKVKQARINIVDVFGKLIETHQVLDTDKYIIYKSDKASGIYFVEIESDNESMFIKMIIE